MKNSILEKVENASLGEILDMDDFTNSDWIWINREIFRDIFINLKLDETLGEEVLEKFLNEIEDKELMSALLGPFYKMGYLPMDQYHFAHFEKGYKPTKDIDTTIFVKEKMHRRLYVKLMNKFSWILKAMALDTYFKMSLGYKNLRETYEELYEENHRMIEEILSQGKHSFVSGRWEFHRETEELYFYKADEFFNSWAEGEVESKFKEFIKKS